MKRMTLCLAIWACAAWAGCKAEPAPRPIEATDVQAAPAAASRPQPLPKSFPVRYTVRFDARFEHKVHVEARIPTDGEMSLELMMPVWTPGSYLVREYARHIEDLQAFDAAGRPLVVRKLKKNRWRVEAGDTPIIAVLYRVYGRDMSVRGNFVADDMAILNGAPTFITIAEQAQRPHEVQLVLPEDWRESVTGLAPLPGAHRYRAPDYDSLVDSPIVAGNPQVHRFMVRDIPHRLATFGGAHPWDGARAAQDVQALVEETIRLWRHVPYGNYVFINVLADGHYGGLEHHTSTLMLFDKWRTAKPEGYLDWLGLVSHELFHTWNVKALRPVGLSPFDYEQEAYTPSLWVAEGFTSYYGDLLLCRAGLLDSKEYLKRLSKRIKSLQETPGRLQQTLEMASFDAWIKHYRPDENSVNTAISYYTKGAVVAFLLDARIREVTDGHKSLDDVMRAAYERFGPETPGYTSKDFEHLASEIADMDLSDFFARSVRSTQELSYDAALAYYGLQFGAPKDDDTPDRSPAWLGVELANKDGRLVVQGVLRDTPAKQAGMQVGDELIAINGNRLPKGGLEDRLVAYQPGDRVTLTLARRGLLRELTATLGEKPRQTWQLQEIAEPSQVQQQRVQAWLGLSESDEMARGG